MFSKLVFLILTVPQFCFADSKFIYFGGQLTRENSDPAAWGIAKVVSNLQEFAKNRPAWNAEFYYNKNQNSSPKDNNISTLKPISRDIYESKIKELTEQIRNGTIKPDSQLMLFIDSHGILDANGQVMFAIGSEYYSVHTLEPLLQAASEKRIKFGLAGMSCYSGDLLRLSYPDLCVITAATADKVGHTGDAISLSEELSNQPDLEKAYLAARNTIWDKLSTLSSPSQPRISTQAGLITQELLRPLNNGIYGDHDSKEQLGKKMCLTFSSSLDKMKSNILQLTQTTSVFRRDSINWRKALSFIPKKMYEDKVAKLIESLEKDIELFRLEYEKKLLESAPIHALGDQLAQAEVCAKTESGRRVCTRADQVMSSWQQSGEKCNENPKREKLSCEDREAFSDMTVLPAYAKYTEHLEKFSYINTQAMVRVSQRIANSERALYDIVYGQVSKTLQSSNPCRDIKL